MAYALVGSAGTTVQSTSGGAITTLAFGQATTANNLLVCWWSGAGATNIAATPSGWSSAITQAGTSSAAAIFYKIAAGSDTAPTFSSITSDTQAAKLAEFSGNATSLPLDLAHGNSGTTGSPITCTNLSSDMSSGELLIGASGADYSATTGSKTLTGAFNNGTATDNNGPGGTVVAMWDFAWTITTTNASASSYTYTPSTTRLVGSAGVIASFLLPIGIPNINMAAAPSGW